jgi:hypothetical protein
LTRHGVVTGAWNEGEEVVDAGDVLLPVGTSPGDYELLVGLYQPGDGTRLRREDGNDVLSLGRLRVVRAATQRVPRLPGAPTLLVGGLRVLGFESESKPRAGQQVPIALYLQPTIPLGVDYRLAVGLLRDGAPMAASEAVPGGSYPPSKWRSGEIVRDIRGIAAPVPGRYRVGVKMLGDQGGSDLRSAAHQLPEGWVLLPGEVIVEP